MFHIALFNPQIPPNTGNIIRLCSNTGSNLHLIKPLGFSMNQKSLRRAGLDYKKNVHINIHNNIDDFLKNNSFKNIYLVTKYALKKYSEIQYQKHDCFIFGSEIDGLSEEVYEKLENSEKILIPMVPKNRSINLANAVSICLYEAWRQNNFLIL